MKRKLWSINDDIRYMPKKPVKRGIKVWVLGDSENGYASNLQVYIGKEESAEKGLGSRVVKDLTRHLKDKHHHVFFDNFFTSVQLLEDLEKEGTYACGTARADRKRFPESLKKVKLSKRYTHTHTQSTVHKNCCIRNQDKICNQ